MDDPEVLDMVRGYAHWVCDDPSPIKLSTEDFFYVHWSISYWNTRISNLLIMNLGEYVLSHFCSSQEGWYYQNDFKFEIFKSIGGVSSL